VSSTKVARPSTFCESVRDAGPDADADVVRRRDRNYSSTKFATIKVVVRVLEGVGLDVYADVEREGGGFINVLSTKFARPLTFARACGRVGPDASPDVVCDGGVTVE
jgi:hypothetical protein